MRWGILASSCRSGAGLRELRTGSCGLSEVQGKASNGILQLEGGDVEVEEPGKMYDEVGVAGPVMEDVEGISDG